MDCESRSGARGKPARAPLDRLSPLLSRETTLLGDDFAFPTAARHALLTELAALGVAAWGVAHALDAIAVADLQSLRTGHRFGRSTERDQQRTRRSHRHDPPSEPLHPHLPVETVAISKLGSEPAIGNGPPRRARPLQRRTTGNIEDGSCWRPSGRLCCPNSGNGPTAEGGIQALGSAKSTLERSEDAYRSALSRKQR